MSTRYLHEMGQVLYDQKWFKTAKPNIELYYVSRKVKTKNDLRYDITIMPAQMLGKEFSRTKGNRNSDGFEELYTVLKGNAIFLMQKTNNQVVEDVKAIKANENDWIIVPPNYLVVTINSSKTKELKTGNWVSENTQNIYKDVEKFNGACWFYTKEGWVKNKNYKKIPELRFEKPLSQIPKNLDFLRTQS